MLGLSSYKLGQNSNGMFLIISTHTKYPSIKIITSDVIYYAKVICSPYYFECQLFV